MTRVYFDNIEKEIISAIDSAESRILIAVAWFTNQLIYDSLLQACQRQVVIKIILLDDIFNRNEFGIDFGSLSNKGAEVRFAVPSNGTMHHKFCIVDDKVITGSYNWTYHANQNNENIILTDEPDVVRNYCVEFENIFNMASPVKLPYEHLKWTDVKEGDFSELRRNIFREVIAQNDIYQELKRTKLVMLNDAYKSGDSEELTNAALLPIEKHFRTITDVLTSRSQNYKFKLWEKNQNGIPYNNVDGYIDFGKWYYIPFSIKEDENHYEFLEGTLKTERSRMSRGVRGLNLKIYDEEFIATIKHFLQGNSLSVVTRRLIPEGLLCINSAKMIFYQFPSPMFNKRQLRTWNKTIPRTITAINLLGIVKEGNGDDVVFYNGWEPKDRGERIMKEFFVKAF